MSEVQVVRVDDEDDDGERIERWERLLDDQNDVDTMGVAAYTGYPPEWPWAVSVYASEFVYRPPFGEVFQDRLDSTLQGVNGVTAVARDDGPVWLIAGSPQPEELVRAVATLLNELEEPLREAMPR
jgi:hypothetical protein